MEPGPEKENDFVIIGSGLGGLVCACVLAMEGYKVLVLEKNHQVGGLLQVYSRDKVLFDTGVHYVGGLDPGENLYQFFKYLGILDGLKIKRMDDDCFDVIRFDDGQQYCYAQGYDGFIRTLKESFPEEENAIIAFCDKIREICEQFPLYNLRANVAGYQTDSRFMEINAFDYIASITDNKRLQNVLAGSNLLYAGVRQKTPLYVHALILNSYLHGAYKFTDGGSQIAIQLNKVLRAYGGKILKHQKVVSAEFCENGKITSVVTDKGEKFSGKEFISNLHPAVTIEMFGEERFLQPYNNRIKKLENSISTFLVHLTFKENAFEYLNHNIYQHHDDDVWAGVDYDCETWPQTYFVCTPFKSKNERYADSMSIMTYMRSSEMDEWAHTTSTIANPGKRDASYEAFKRKKEEQVLRRIETVFPDILSKVKSVHSATPLTFRDYIGTKDGSMYGILKDSGSTARTQINTRTRIPNLHLTGQNLNMHGILGVTVSAFVTCFSFVDKDILIQKVKNA